MSTTQQPEALRLADALERPGYGWHSTPAQCAAELRRLHAENTTLQQGYAAARLEIESLRVRSLPEIKDMHNGPQQLNLSDRAMWVLGWNECRDAIRDADRAMRAAQPAGAQQPGANHVELTRAQCSKVVDAVIEKSIELKTTNGNITIVYDPATMTAAIRDALRASHGQAPAQAAPAAVAGPSEAVKFTDQSTADPVEKARRYLTAMGDQRTNSAYFYDDGYPRRESAQDALATLAILEQLAAAPTTRQEPILYDPKALLEVFQKAQAGSSSTAGTLRGIAAVVASWESRPDPHTWLIAAPQPSPAAQVDALTKAARDVLAERQRQISAEGWTPEHDDEHLPGELSLAAASYVCADEGDAPPAIWPWDWSWWKPRDRRRNLVKSGALVLAELERMDRADAARAAQEGK